VGYDPIIGQMVGSYRVERALGAGSTGAVYLAEHPDIGSRVAVKVLSAEASRSPKLVRRFVDEARAVNLIRHENIINVVDLCEVLGRPCIVMEYIDGCSLAERIDAGPMSMRDIGQIAGEALSALHAAHRRGVLHRDIKPENIYVTARNHTRVLDFGIAKLRPLDVSQHCNTTTGVLLGTPYYMAPELARGRPVDHRADLYSMGAVLFEAVTGQRPFHSENLYELLQLHVRAPVPSVVPLRPDAPAALDEVIARALAKEPAHRFASARQMRDALLAACGLPRERRRSADERIPAMAESATPVTMGGAERGFGDLRMVDGALSGYWTYWDDAGNLVRVDEYDGGEVVRTVSY
jgi:serine/threonine-protein kinase